MKGKNRGEEVWHHFYAKLKHLNGIDVTGKPKGSFPSYFPLQMLGEMLFLIRTEGQTWNKSIKIDFYS